MRSGIFTPLCIENKNKANGHMSESIRHARLGGYLKGVFLGGVMLTSLSVFAQPTFYGSNPQNDTVCANVPTDISSTLEIYDGNIGSVETFTLTAAPSNGVITGLPTTVSSDGSYVTPSGVTYTPNPGYYGTDVAVITVNDGLGNSATHTILLTVNQPITLTLGANPSICAGATSASISYSNLTVIGPDTTIYGTGTSTFSVPSFVNSVVFDVQGARGGRDNATPTTYPGSGGRIQGVLAVTPGEQLNLYVGGVGSDGSATGATGGFNGGGTATFYVYGSGGGGGGASDIRVAGTALSNRVVVAGGGGGSGYDDPGPRAGGSGGGYIGGSSSLNGGGHYAAGGSQSAGGAGAIYPSWAPGMNGSLATGGNGSTDGISGGGGGGFYGGGGGVWTGGGGGSSYADTTGGLVSSVVNTQGYDTSNGKIAIMYVVPGTYNITWDASATLNGFRDTTAALPGSSPFTFAVPASAPAAVYSGTITVSSPTCSSVGYPINVTINPIPAVNPVSNQSVCNGDSTAADILFTGSVVGAVYTWANNNTSIGLPSNGTGKISRFEPTNSTLAPAVATITVTPTANGCSGTPTTFTITDNPIPMLGSTLVPPAICDSTDFIYAPTSDLTSVPGTTFTWSRAAISGISNPTASGADTANEYLVNTTNATIPVSYQYISDFRSCYDTQNVVVNVYPHPFLTSSLNPAAVCSNLPFIYTQSSAVSGTEITWSRAAVAGISNVASSDSGNIDETLVNTTGAPVSVVYIDTLNYNGCSYTQAITATINPTPTLSTPLIAPSTCDSLLFNYGPNSATAGTTTYSWTRGEVIGISNPGNSGTDTVNEYLFNTTAYPIVVTYAYTLTDQGCVNNQNVTDTIKPTPVLASAPTDTVCSNTVLVYSAYSNTPGTSYAWVRNTTIGISNVADSNDINEIAEVLIDTTTGTEPVTYVYTLNAEGCLHTQDVVVYVNPTPKLNNNPSIAAVCNDQTFNYSPTSATSGASFTWSRAFVPGIDDAATSNSGGISESLNNTTYVNVNVAYVYTVVANGCVNTDEVILTVHPTPVLSSDTTATICSGTPFNYAPTSNTPTTIFAWSVAPIPGVTAAALSDSGDVSDTLTSSYTVDTSAVFVFTLTAYGCTNTQDVTVNINPSPSVPTGVLTTYGPSAACDNTMYQNFGTSIAPPTGMSYSWVADNAQVYAIGATGQYALINFNTPGTATIYLLINNNATGCLSNSGYTVNVSGTENSSPKVIYVNGQFICQSTDVMSYQWGYDNAATLDSTLIAGETNQNYFNSNFDPSNPVNYYWVITTTSGGCLQKSYFNAPAATTGIVNVNGENEIKIYPNPARESVNVAINATGAGTFKIEVLNMLGQVVNTVATADKKTNIDVTGLAAGCYMVDCYRDGMKIATAKFIKN